ncbi:MAG: glycosyltransferase family 2 protein [Stenomitos frigidus ULC029]
MISVITPVYNGERFIESCIQNVINQDCSDVEHIIIDAASKDKTVDIIKQYAERYPHIRWISEPDQGQSDAMNKGIKIATGTVLSFLNIDDYYEPNAINRVLERFKTLPEPSLLVGNCNVWEDGDKFVEVNKPKNLKFTDLLLGPCVNAYPLNPSAYFYHASLHQKIGLYKLDEHYAMDIDFLFRAVQAATVTYVDETWGNYRKFKGTKTANDIENGQNLQRIEQLIKRYRNHLPLLQRWYLTLAYHLETFDEWRKVRYFLRHPSDLIPSLKNKLIERFNSTV